VQLTDNEGFFVMASHALAGRSHLLTSVAQDLTLPYLLIDEVTDKEIASPIKKHDGTRNDAVYLFG
jgi:hypothetical protein